MPFVPPQIDPDIRRASTLAPAFYRDPETFERTRAAIFARSWQLAGDTRDLRTPGQVRPLTLLEGCLDEPLLLTRDADDRLHCLSNVCTHRANLVAPEPCRVAHLRCPYHGRRFGLDGTFEHMPEFDLVEGFPGSGDDLAAVPFGTWGPLVFCAIDPAFSLEDALRPMRERVGWLPLDEFALEPARSRDYLVRANWALYCDNYLEGFHIPFVHSGLNAELDYGSYHTELHRYSSLQLGIARSGEGIFDLPSASPDHGEPIAAYYFWVFPNLMFNFYPWGLSINVVKPLGPDRTRVSFLSYVWDASRVEEGAGAALDRVEREDEAIVESVQRAAVSRLARPGRYSPTREQGVHHFHRLIAEFLTGG